MRIIYLRQVINDLGVNRMRVIERMSKQEVELQVPSKWVDKSRGALTIFFPVGVNLKVTKLSWWRGWFTPFQTIKEP